MPPLRVLCALLLFAARARACGSGRGCSDGGCECLSSCGYSVLSVTYPWCRTSPIPPPLNWSGCGAFDTDGNYYWDTCRLNLTASTSVVLLTDFSSCWVAIAASAVATVAAVYAVAGCVAAAQMPPPLIASRALLPLAAALLGGCHALVAAAAGAALLAFYYLSLPYALDRATAVSFGVAIAAVLIYGGVGHQRNGRPNPPHPSEYEEQ